MPTIDSLLSKPQNLPNVPEVMRELVQTFNEKEPDILLIAKKINKDPVISAKLLRLAMAAVARSPPSTRPWYGSGSTWCATWCSPAA